ncbi:MAG TPA: GTP 3',8-cyclase MoaA [Anaeromyxobacter sp.]|nr:GTP 3',8-cyclase MoaA [Anaeromyxobacter sp.]
MDARRATAVPLSDGLGRRIEYLRLSLTRRCNFRCSYCSPCPVAERPGAVLDPDEIRALVAGFARLGVRRVRLTGGEPTLRRDLVEIVAAVAAVPGIEEVAITTNGQRLGSLAAALRGAGVTRVNVSLDTLRRERLTAVSGPAASLERVIEGIEAAALAGFASLKLNTVVLGGVNEDELGALVRFAWSARAVPRLIELMPFGRGERVPVARMKALLERQGVSLEPAETRLGWGPASYHAGHSEEGGRRIGGAVGFIGAMTETFCEACNRVRVGPDGALRPCLARPEEVPLRDLLRPSAPRGAFEERVRAALLAKAPRHDLDLSSVPRPSMSSIGG